MEQNLGLRAFIEADSGCRKLFSRMALSIFAFLFAHNVFASTPITSVYYPFQTITDTIIAASCTPSPYYGTTICAPPSTFTCTSKEACYQAARTSSAYYCPFVAPNAITSYMDITNYQWSDCIIPVSGNNVVGVIYSVTTSATNICPAGTNYYSPWEVCVKGECPSGETLSGDYPYWTCKGQNPLTLILQGGATSIGPWNEKHDPDHEQANVLFAAIVVDSKGTPKPNIPVTITSTVADYSGGHHHTDGRPKGELAATVADMATGASSLTVNTDNQGLATFYFGAEEASGEHTITATCKGCTNGPRTAKVSVEITGLGKFGGENTCNTIFCLRGDKPQHPENHYFNAEAMNKIAMLAIQYYTKFQKDILPQSRQPLKINDSSLKKGGLYDLNENWKPSHKGHRKGVVVDINNFSARNLLFEKFVGEVNLNGIRAIAIWEGLNVSPMPHYHLRLLGRDE